MLNLLARIFIKDYKNVKNEKVRSKYGVLAGIFGIITNLILVAIKLSLGIIFMSISIIADAMNNLSDMGSSLLTLIGFKVSSKPADKEHPFGHQRIEYIIGLVIAMVIAFVGIELLTESINKIITPNPISSEIITYVLLGVAILLKVFQGLFYLSASKRISSISLKASAKDSINDVIATSAILIGTIVSKLINYNLDGIIGVLVSVFIIITAIGLIKESISPLIGEKPDPSIVNAITTDIKSYKGIYGIHDMIAHLYGPNKIFITLHCEVDRIVDVMESHDLIDTIEIDIKKKYGVEIVIHMDPIVIGDPIHDKIKGQVINVVKDISDELRIHDFRMVKGNVHINLIFDLVVPFGKKFDNDTLVSTISREMKLLDERYNCVINIDEDYVD